MVKVLVCSILMTMTYIFDVFMYQTIGLSENEFKCKDDLTEFKRYYLHFSNLHSDTFPNFGNF